MDIDRYLDQARERVRTRGVHLQGVFADTPLDATFGYSVGLSEAAVPHPELIAFSCCVDCVNSLLRAALQRIREQGPLAAGATVQLWPGTEVRVEAVQPRWVSAHALLAPTLLGRASADIPMVQLVTSDRAGRWPEDPAVDLRLLDDQPLLSCDVPWQVPVQRALHGDVEADTPPPGTVPLAVPVLSSLVPEGRYEVLRAQPLADGSARVATVPWRADHLSYGAVVETRPAEGIPGLPPGTVEMGVLLEAGWEARAFSVAPGLQAGDRAWLWPLQGDRRHRLSSSAWTVHVNTSDGAAFDRAARHLVRDGLLQPTALHCESDLVDPTPAALHGDGSR